ncbi:MAG: insulinase family protein [Holophagaceae bacterium]|nr:insulinase family protein [Holophagaceae bacterium]
MKDYKGKEVIAQGEAFDASPENVEARTVRFTTPNGLKAALLSRKTKGAMASLQLTLRFGREAELMDRKAVPGLTGAMLMRGTTKHTRQELADAFDKLRAQVMVNATAILRPGHDPGPRENLTATLKLVAEVLREPAFPAAELETLVKQQTTGIEAQRNEPQAKSVEFMGQTFDAFPAGHPMAYRGPDARLEELKNLKVEDLKAFHQAFYGANHAALAASGDFDTAEVQKLVSELFGSWNSPAAYERIAVRLKAPNGTRQAIETPDKKGAFFLAQARWAMKDTDADYPAFFMANQILGGGMLKSRLADRLRQKEGFSYGAGSVLNVGNLDAVTSWFGLRHSAPGKCSQARGGLRRRTAEGPEGRLHPGRVGLRPQQLDPGREDRAPGRSGHYRLAGPQPLPGPFGAVRSGTGSQNEGPEARRGQRRPAQAPPPRDLCGRQGRRLRQGCKEVAPFFDFAKRGRPMPPPFR